MPPLQVRKSQPVTLAGTLAADNGITGWSLIMIKHLILKNRSYRRFHQDEAVNCDTLWELIDLARLSASGANLQPLKYFLHVNLERTP
jgi:hypothetical protein